MITITVTITMTTKGLIQVADNEDEGNADDDADDDGCSDPW